MLFRSDWMYLVQSVMIAVAMLFPFLLETGQHLKVPPVFKIFIIMFVFSGMFLGSVNGVYYRIFWWDSALHLLSGLPIGLFAYSIALHAYRRKNGDAGLSHGIALLLIFCFIMTIGALWEIVEFACDTFLGMNMQRESLLDTMSDILFNTLGAVVFTLAAHHGLKGRIHVLDKLAIRAGTRQSRAKGLAKATAVLPSDVPD